MLEGNRLEVEFWVGKIESTTPGRRGNYQSGHGNTESANSNVMNCFFCIEAEDEKNEKGVASSRSLGKTVNGMK